MKILLSPTKTMKASNITLNQAATIPFFQSKARYIHGFLKTWSLTDLKKRMKLSDNLAIKSLKEIEEWDKDKYKHPSVLYYSGTAFKSMQPTKWSKDEILFAQERLLILSALYGVLSPYDLISPYRLEMGITHSFLPGYGNLYEYWKPFITTYLNDITPNSPIINLASKEYIDVVNHIALKAKLINCHFLENKNGSLKVLGNYAKSARGLMTNFIITNKISNVDGVKLFESNGYKFDLQRSDENNLYFIRKH